MKKEEKIQEAKELEELIKKHSTIAILDIYKLPSKQLQEIRKKLRDVALIKIIKKSVLIHSIENLEEGKKLEELLPRQPGIILTNLEPFKLYLTVSKLKSKTFAKAGDVINSDIIIPAGPTGLSPGPVISEFGKLKIPVGIEKGKIVVKKDTLVAKKGDVVTKELASILRKLKIEPIEIGLNIVAIFGDGRIFTKDVLELVGEKTIKKVIEAYRNALNLSVAIGYPTKENIKYLFMKAYQIANKLKNIIGG